MDSKISKIPCKPLIGIIFGGVLEIYDLIIFGLLAPNIAHLFFPSDSKLLPILASYITFAVGYFFRPLGSIIFGHIGDKYGRRTALYSCLLIMAISTLAIGIMPTYKSIGILAPCFIILARIMQGISAGGELAGGLIYILENTHYSYKGLVAGLVWAGCNGGVLLGSLVVLAFNSPNMPEWAWRVPFIIGFFIALIGLYIRIFLPETPEFIAMKKQRTLERFPLIRGIKCFYKQMIASVLITTFFGIVYFFNVIVLQQIFTKTFHISSSLVQLKNILLLLFMTMSYPIFGFCADRFNKATLAKISIISLGVLTTGCICILNAKLPNVLNRYLYHIVAGIVMASYTSICQLFLISAFKKNILYSCFGTSYTAGMAISSTFPFIATILVQNDNYIMLSMLIVIASILALFSVYGVENFSLKQNSVINADCNTGAPAGEDRQAE